MKYVTLIDNTGRTILAEEYASSENTITVKNPAMIHVGQTQQGQLQVQLLPLFFPEFLAQSQKDAGTYWEYSRDAVAIGKDIQIEEKILEQYKRVFNPSPIIQAPANPPINV